MNKFNFFIPIDFEKSESGNPEDQYKNMIIQGEASDSSEDADQEILEPNGFDISEFNRSGLINLEHFPTRRGDPSAWIGEPIKAEIKNNKFVVKAKLWEKSEKARQVWDTMKVMQESGSNRKPGWSIEGVATKRDPHNPKRILKAKIKHCALTFSPKNYNSWADIVKGNIVDDFVDNFENKDEFLFEYEKGGEVFRILNDFSIQKAMSAGMQTGTELTGQNTNGAALKRESLDKDLKVLAPEILKSLKDIVKKYESKEIDEETFGNIKKYLKKFFNI